MRRSAWWVLLLAAAATDAAAQRMTLEVPLSPSLQSRVAPALYESLTIQSPAVLSLSAPMLAAPSIQAAPIPLTPNLALPASVIAARPRAAASVPVTAGQGHPAKVIDGLREHGMQAAKLSERTGEAGAAALESNFMAAASLDDSVPASGTDDGAAAAAPTAPDTRPLFARLRERVRVNDRGRPDEKKVLEEAFRRLLETPTGRRHAEEFIAEGHVAHVHLADIPESKLTLGYAQWHPEGYAEVSLSRHFFIDAAAEDRRKNLPAILGHELFGHGLWLSRASKEVVFLAYGHHALDEINATLLGWNIEHELDGRFERGDAWNYLADEAGYAQRLKFVLPGYAVTFSREEMDDPIGTLRARQTHAGKKIEAARTSLAALKAWLPVLDYFANGHGIPKSRFDMLRKEIGEHVAQNEYSVANAELVRERIADMIVRMDAEPGRFSELYLRRAASHQLFERLSASVKRLSDDLKKRVTNEPRASDPLPHPRPADQITWEELTEMYRNDVAADARRPAVLRRWR